MKKSSTAITVLMLGAAIIIAAGCSKKETAQSTARADQKPAAPVELTMWLYSDWAPGGGIGGDFFQKWGDAFVKANPEVSKITMLSKNDNDLKTSILANVGLPDCFTFSETSGKSVVAVIDYLNLKPYYDKEGADYKEGWNQAAITAVADGDQMYCLPFAGFVQIIFRNLTVLEKAGIDPAEGEPTWDVFLEHCAKIKQAGVDPTHKWAGQWRTAGGMLGAEMTLTPGIKDGKTTITAAQLLPSYQYLMKLKPYTNNMSQQDQAAAEAFKTNKLAYKLDGPWSNEGYAASGVKYDIVPLPALKAGGRTGGVRGADAVYGVNGSHNDLVWKWLRYITDYNQLYEFAAALGRPVYNDKVNNAPELQNNIVMKASAPGMNNNPDAAIYFKSGVTWPFAVADPTNDMDAGRLTPQQAAEETIKKINELIEEDQD
jgi:multiple sugar transport system substrate-binding protein